MEEKDFHSITSFLLEEMKMCGCLLLFLAFVVFVVFVVALIASTIALAVKIAISVGSILLVIFVLMLIRAGTR